MQLARYNVNVVEPCLSGSTNPAGVRLERPPFDYAHVLFVCLDPEMKSVDPPPYFGDAAVHLINRVRWAIGEKQSYSGGVVQVQVLDQTPVKLNQAQRDQNQNLLEAVMEHAFGG